MRKIVAGFVSILFIFLTSCALNGENSQSSMESGTSFSSKDDESIEKTDSSSSVSEGNDSQGDEGVSEDNNSQGDEDASEDNASQSDSSSDWWLGEIPVNN